jgi:hypothetical protein
MRQCCRRDWPAVCSPLLPSCPCCRLRCPTGRSKGLRCVRHVNIVPISTPHNDHSLYPCSLINGLSWTFAAVTSSYISLPLRVCPPGGLTGEAYLVDPSSGALADKVQQLLFMTWIARTEPGSLSCVFITSRISWHELT